MAESTRQREIRCRNHDGEHICGRFLALLDGLTLRIFCPRCKGWHEIDLASLCQHLDEFLDDAERAGGSGFML